MPPKRKYTRRNVCPRPKPTRKVTKIKCVQFLENPNAHKKKKLIRKPTPYPVRRCRAPKLRPMHRIPLPLEDCEPQSEESLGEILEELSTKLKPFNDNEFDNMLRGVFLGLNVAAAQIKKEEERKANGTKVPTLKSGIPTSPERGTKVPTLKSGTPTSPETGSKVPTPKSGIPNSPDAKAQSDPTLAGDRNESPTPSHYSVAYWTSSESSTAIPADSKPKPDEQGGAMSIHSSFFLLPTPPGSSEEFRFESPRQNRDFLASETSFDSFDV